MSDFESRRQQIHALRELLADSKASPVEAVVALGAQRRKLAAHGGDSLDVARQELDFLRRQAEVPGAPDELQRQVLGARHAAAAVELESLQRRGADDAAVLFDLAELQAECQACGFDTEAAAAALTRREVLKAIEPSLVSSPSTAGAGAGGDSDGDGGGSETISYNEEARERWAALASTEDDMPLHHKVRLLEETADVMAGLGERTGESLYPRLEGRLRRSANEVGLQERVEGLLGRRGAMLLETFSFIALVAVMVLIVVEATVLDPERDREIIKSLRVVDGAICLFFIAEFAFKFILAPRRGSWFWRNMVTDLLPAIPAVLLLMTPGGALVAGQENVAGLRILRVFRVVQMARYIQAVAPVLRLLRLVLFLVRGLDGLVRRFRPLINRNFVFFEPVAEQQVDFGSGAGRRVVFQALRREHVLLQDMPRSERFPALEVRARLLQERLRDARGSAELDTQRQVTAVNARDVPVDQAVEFLYELKPEDLGLWMPRRDVRALDRVVRIINAPLVRSLPLLRSLRIDEMPTQPESRVTAFARSVAARLEAWQGRLHFTADLHGIVTGPQVLDRVASAMVKASQRPAVRLLLFGGLFTLARLVIGEGGPVGEFLGKFVATPLVVLGSVCLVFLAVGRWLKLVAGEAADTFKLTSEAHFLGLMDLVKRRSQEEDLSFLVQRLFRWELPEAEAVAALRDQVEQIRRGRDDDPMDPPPELHEDLHRAALLYLHFLDGAILHESDVKTTEQLLANLAMENIRQGHLGMDRKDRKRLKKLSLQDGSLFGGPYLWFRFITESVAVETAKRITEYNRHCLTLAQRGDAPDEFCEAMDRWLAKKLDEKGGRTLERLPPPGRGERYHTTEFNALDFVAGDVDRDERLRRIFGDDVLKALRRDRSLMIREIFGTRPVHRLPRSKRSVNFHRFYMQRLSSGRIFLLPLYLLWASFRLGGRFVGKTRQIVTEILRPHLAEQSRVSGQANFAVALRKIHRMKAPGLLEAMRTRVSFDPSYCGAPSTWSFDAPFEEDYQLERDMDFLDLKEREREPLRLHARTMRRRVGELHGLIRDLPSLAREGETKHARHLGERAVTVAYATNRQQIRFLLRAPAWLEETLPEMEAKDTRIAASFTMGVFWALVGVFRRHPVDRWLRSCLDGRRVSRRGRRNFKRAWRARSHGVRSHVGAWLALDSGRRPQAAAWELAGRFYRNCHSVSREIVALRTVQSLSVLDVRNYRRLVFQLGNYEADGEDPAEARALP